MGFARQYQQLRLAGVLAHMTSEARHSLGAKAMQSDSLFELLHDAGIIRDKAEGNLPAGALWVGVEDQGRRGFMTLTPEQKTVVATIFKIN